MADYFSPTVLQQPIPVADMTPLERLVLSLIFDAEPDGDALYFHTSVGPSDAIRLADRRSSDGVRGIRRHRQHGGDLYRRASGGRTG